MINELAAALDKVTDIMYSEIDRQLTVTQGKMPSQEVIDEGFRTALGQLTHGELVEISFFVLSNPDDAHNVIDAMVTEKGIEQAGRETCILQK
jgi:hypothetical protein